MPVLLEVDRGDGFRVVQVVEVAGGRDTIRVRIARGRVVLRATARTARCS